MIIGWFSCIVIVIITIIIIIVIGRVAGRVAEGAPAQVDEIQVGRNEPSPSPVYINIYISNEIQVGRNGPSPSRRDPSRADTHTHAVFYSYLECLNEMLCSDTQARDGHKIRRDLGSTWSASSPSFKNKVLLKIHGLNYRHKGHS